ncbi:hypothetical protein DERP_008532 [Dermatophagoides pteronyssinus]|uniref:Uncharacterized protein n=1 Tax=Dermatophagoides pteronyssinus TaxID=6956 RepID=A0ABQ8IWN2_DERPT|nr:hypothetical protein DERP_008532 [Dermatophagoides pteronyssinus]
MIRIEFSLSNLCFKFQRRFLLHFFRSAQNYLDNPDNEELRMIYPRYFPPPPPPPPPPFR